MCARLCVHVSRITRVPVPMRACVSCACVRACVCASSSATNSRNGRRRAKDQTMFISRKCYYALHVITDNITRREPRAPTYLNRNLKPCVRDRCTGERSARVVLHQSSVLLPFLLLLLLFLLLLLLLLLLPLLLLFLPRRNLGEESETGLWKQFGRTKSLGSTRRKLGRRGKLGGQVMTKERSGRGKREVCR